MQGIPEYQMQYPLGGLPVNLVLVGNPVRGRVVFVTAADKFKSVIDQPEGENAIGGVFSDEGFALFEEWVGGAIETFDYNTIYDYKEIPLMLKWLQQQNLQEPNTIFG